MTASRKDTNFKTGLYMLAVLCALIFVGSKIDWISSLFVSDVVNYGDLYPELTVRYFKVERVHNVHRRFPANEDTRAADADILLIGDSFLDYDGETYTCADEFSKALGQSIYVIHGGDPQRYVAAALEREKIPRDSKRRKLILECVERNFMYLYRHGAPSPSTGGSSASTASSVVNLAREISHTWFTDSERRYQYLLNTSVLTSGFIEAVSTMKFREFGMMPKRFPVYSLHPPMVFSYFETNPNSPTSYFYPHTQEDIEAIAVHLKELSEWLSLDWNLDLVVLPIPNKITIYHKLATDVSYDDYLPRLIAELRRQGVPTVDLYTPFRQAEGRIYYSTDTHWNPRGVDLATQVVAGQLGDAGTSDH
ncbi:MAG: hypothetical protein KDB65_07885 [Calditrichaeota bacterium]|nr:hypothetical protein [Calditrichota bacterium]MCB9369391.1 hypothetical protein [Calditrichota bacterium]